MLRQRVRQAAHSGVDCLSQVAEQSAATKAAALQLAQDKLQTMSTELGRLEIKLVRRPCTSTPPLGPPTTTAPCGGHRVPLARHCLCVSSSTRLPPASPALSDTRPLCLLTVSVCFTAVSPLPFLSASLRLSPHCFCLRHCGCLHEMDNASVCECV